MNNRNGGLIVGAAVAALVLSPPNTVRAQDLPLGEWVGAARFSDGVESRWHLHLWRGADGVEGDLLFGAGSGVVLRNLSSDGARISFVFVDPGLREEMQCTLEEIAPGWSGRCATSEIQGNVDLSPLPSGPHPSYADDGPDRPRARDVGLVVGVIRPGRFNAITDVEGVLVGHVTVEEGEDIRTGVTVIVPAAGDLYAHPVPAWIHTVNGYGKLVGETQVREFGEMETPLLLTCTLCVWSAARGLAWTLMERDSVEHTINPVVGETNDSWLNDMWEDPVRREHVEEALRVASSGPVPEGSVGAGTGTGAFGWKGGIGTSSRVLPASLGGYTVGVLVQTNFGGVLTMNGAPVGREFGSFTYRSLLADSTAETSPPPEDGGSLMIVVATDAPLTPSTIERLAKRAMLGVARTGSFAHNSSGDYVIAFSTAESVRRVRSDPAPRMTPELLNAQMSPLFAAVVEATEEAIYNAILRATTVRGRGRVMKALPLTSTLEVLRRHGVLEWDRSVPVRRSP